MLSKNIRYQQCPLCGSKNIQFSFQTQDFMQTASALKKDSVKSQFDIWHCKNCTLGFTQDVPDQEAISMYYQSSAYISHSDTQKGWMNYLYHLARKYTIYNKKKFIEKLTGLKTGALLDIGAGTGSFVQGMQEAGWQVLGLEPDQIARENALQKYGISLESAEAIYSLKPQKYDVISLWHVLEHVHDVQGYFDRFRHILKPNGKLIIAVPNYTSKDAQHYKQYWAAYDVPRHLYHFSPKSMELLAMRQGFRVQKMQAMWLDSFYVSLLSEKYKHQKISPIRAFWNGFLSNYQAIKDCKKSSSIIYVLEFAPLNNF